MVEVVPSPHGDDDGYAQHHHRHQPYHHRAAEVVVSPVAVCMPRDACAASVRVHTSVSVQAAAAVAQAARTLLAAPDKAAEMLPMVTAMFIQCRNVRSLAA